MARSHNWKNVINPKTGWADGRYANGKWLGCKDLVSRQSFITEGSICHYSWYVPHDIDALVERMGGKAEFERRLDMMFALKDSSSAARLLYWHGNEPCHQIPFLYSYIGKPEKSKRVVDNILKTEYNDTPGGLSGNDDAGQMSAWYMFAAMGFYPVCPSTPYYIIGSPSFDRVTFNLENKKQFEIIRKKSINNSNFVRLILNGKQLDNCQLSHGDIINGGKLIVEE
jgi:predicted alpha-1,2-mannosidase